MWYNKTTKIYSAKEFFPWKENGLVPDSGSF